MQVVLGAGGAVGRAVVRELISRNARIKAITLNMPDRVVPGVQHVRFNPAELSKHFQEAATVYHCAAPSYGRWAQDYPVLQRQVLAALQGTEATLVYADNLLMYGVPRAPLEETHPHSTEQPRGRLRSQLAQALLTAHHEGRARVAIARASTLIGPEVHSSWTSEDFFQEVLSRNTLRWPGDLQKPHSLTYVQDFAKALVLLGQGQKGLGEVWHVPTDLTCTALELADLLSDLTGHPVKPHQVPSIHLWVKSQLSRVHPTPLDLAYQFNTPFIVQGRKFQEAFGFQPTPRKQVLQETLEHLRQKG
ncbi:NAD-dependent epimerase/dehydratase family protein [Deinococcus cellulosilyticus]|uniref:NAD-dependent epimerase n=1 Tax=Deinococcus cellulosilyticus (strain DSM 18568 / NBRC 106333 / KACC 11606 / 5516J-15) TaxID=1223518 RepID=A0A511N0X2_DEIC1|nr:NAD-dependent epimerase/dehydratase family protein [Deinococcus cellulosilyticus]GEM46504.1 NAD-dependent epimerase [Deinococcus cellulosilyticus NBRC 106333 = KACC 11606]